MQTRAQVPEISELDIVGVLYANIGRAKVARSRYIPHDQDSHSGIEIGEIMVV